MTADVRNERIVAALTTARDLLAESGTDNHRFGFEALGDEAAFLDAVDALCEELAVQLRVRRGSGTEFDDVRAAFAASKPDPSAVNPECRCSEHHQGPGDHYRDGCHVQVATAGGKDDCRCLHDSGFTADQVRVDAWAVRQQPGEPHFD